MPRHVAILLFILSLLALSSAAAPPAAPPPTPDEINRLIRQLGDNDFDRREAASKRLTDIGVHGWIALRRTMNAPGDAEIRTRCARILDILGQRSFPALPTLQRHTGQVNTLSLSADGKNLLSGGSESVAYYWDVTQGEPTHTRIETANGCIWAVALSPDGKRCLTSVGSAVDGPRTIKGKDYTIRVLDADLNDVKNVRRLVGHTDEIYALVFLPDGKRALSGGRDRTVRLWDVDAGKEIRKFVGHTGPIRRLAVSSDGKQMLSSSQDSTVRCWNVDTGEEISRFTGHRADVFGVAFVPDGKHAVSVGADKMARLWVTATAQEVRRFEGHATILWGVAVSPDGRWLLTAPGMTVRPGYVPAQDDFDIRLWDLASGDEMHRFTGNTSAVDVVLFAPDGKSIFSGGYDTTIRRWQFGLPPAR